MTPRDYAALTPLIWTHVNPYGRLGAGLILSTPRMLESVNSGAQRGAGGHVGLIGATLPT